MRNTAIAAALAVLVLASPSRALGFEAGERVNIDAGCFLEEHARELGEAAATAHRFGIDLYLADPTNTCTRQPGPVNATIVRRAFAVGPLQFWVVRPDNAGFEVYTWTPVADEGEEV